MIEKISRVNKKYLIPYSFISFNGTLNNIIRPKYSSEGDEDGSVYEARWGERSDYAPREILKGHSINTVESRGRSFMYWHTCSTVVRLYMCIDKVEQANFRDCPTKPFHTPPRI